MQKNKKKSIDNGRQELTGRMAALGPQGSSLRKGTARTRSRDVTRIQDHDEDKFEIESKIRERKNRILDALETRYHKSGTGCLLFSEPSSRRRMRWMESTWQRPSSATRTEETSVPEELPQDSRINTNKGGLAPTVSDAKKTAYVSGTVMINPNATKNTYCYVRLTTGSNYCGSLTEKHSAADARGMRIRHWRLTTNV